MRFHVSVGIGLLLGLAFACGGDAEPADGELDAGASSGVGGASSSGAGGGTSSSSSGAAGASSSGSSGEGPSASACTVERARVAGASDSVARLDLMLDRRGDGYLIYNANGVSTGELVQGTFAARVAAGRPSTSSRLGNRILFATAPLSGEGYVAALAESAQRFSLQRFVAGVGQQEAMVDAPVESLVSVGSTRYTSGILSSVASGRRFDALWLAAYDADGTERIAPHEVDFAERSVEHSRWVEREGVPWLVYTVRDEQGALARSWRRVGSDGALGEPVSSSSSGPLDSVVSLGDKLAIGWTSYDSLTPVRTSARLMTLQWATGELLAQQSFENGGAVAIAPHHAGGLWATHITTDGQVELHETNAELEVLRTTPLATQSRAQRYLATAVKEIDGGAVVAYVDDEGGVHLVRATCP